MPREWRLEGGRNTDHRSANRKGQPHAAVQQSGCHLEVDPPRVTLEQEVARTLGLPLSRKFLARVRESISASCHCCRVARGTAHLPRRRRYSLNSEYPGAPVAPKALTPQAIFLALRAAQLLLSRRYRSRTIHGDVIPGLGKWSTPSAPYYLAAPEPLRIGSVDVGCPVRWRPQSRRGKSMGASLLRKTTCAVPSFVDTSAKGVPSLSDCSLLTQLQSRVAAYHVRKEHMTPGIVQVMVDAKSVMPHNLSGYGGISNGTRIGAR